MIIVRTIGIKDKNDKWNINNSKTKGKFESVLFVYVECIRNLTTSLLFLLYHSYKIDLVLSTRSTNTKKEKVFIVGIFNQVHHCVNAFLPKHKCRFAICEGCKSKLKDRHQDQQGATKRTRNSLQNSSKKRGMLQIWKQLLTSGNIKTKLEERNKSQMENAIKSTIMKIVTWRQLAMFRSLTMHFSNKLRKQIVHFEPNAINTMPSFAKSNWNETIIKWIWITRRWHSMRPITLILYILLYLTL